MKKMLHEGSFTQRAPGNLQKDKIPLLEMKNALKI